MNRKMILFALVSALVWGNVSLSRAHSQAVGRGLEWLASAQSPDGSWGDRGSLTDMLTATVSVVETLRLFDGQTLPGYASALSWLESRSVETTDDLAQRLRVLPGSDADRLLALRDASTGAWGGAGGYEVNPLDTASALQALRTLSFSDPTFLQPALAYLLSTQNPDGGWGLNRTDPSNVYLTAVVTSALQSFPQTVPLAAAVHRAASFLTAHQNTDGGFGQGTSTVFETAAACPALMMGVTQEETASEKAVHYLEVSQLPDGSWDADPYATASALRVLHLHEFPPVHPSLGSIEGRVLDGQTGLPLAGVEATLSGPTPGSLITGADGVFLFSRLSAGSYHLELILSGYAPVRTATVVSPGRSIDLGALRMLKGLSEPTGTILGTVSDAISGLPLAEAEVTVSPVNRSVVTTSEGTYQISGIPPGRVTVTVGKEGYAARTGTGEVVSGGVLVFSPRLSPSMASEPVLEGTITDAENGFPLEGVMVAVSGSTAATVRTDPEGHYRIEELSPGEITIRCILTGYDPVSVKAIVYENVSLLFSPRLYPVGTTPGGANTAGVSGLVMDASTNLPLSPVSISWDTGTLQTDAQGRFSIQGLTDSEVTLSFSLQGYIPVSFSVPLSPLEITDLGQVRLRPEKVGELLPDLVVKAMDRQGVETDPRTLHVSGHLGATIVNEGTVSAQVGIEVLAFFDADFNGLFDPGIDVALGRASPANALEAQGVEQVAIPIEGELPFRDAPLTVWVDSGQTVVESREENNTFNTMLSCRADPLPAGQLDLKLKWHWSGSTFQPASKQVMVAPVVAQLNDDNGDGLIDSGDIPDVIFSTFAGSAYTGVGLLRAVSGADGSEIWPPEIRTASAHYGPAVGDIDHDGLVEIIVGGPSYRGLKVYENDGTLKWEKNDFTQGAQPALADIDHDGNVEIVYGRRVYDAGGSMRWGLPLTDPRYEDPAPVIADLDMDGMMEIVSRGKAYNSDGTLIWDCGMDGSFGAVANLDDDPYPEIIMVNYVVYQTSYVYVLEHTGEIRWGPVAIPGMGSGPNPSPTLGRGGGPVTVSDVDGDGDPEIGIAGANSYVVFEGDGSFKWASRTYDPSSYRTGSSVFDFEGDGKAEILYADELNFWIFDGETGTPLKQIPNSSATVYEYPLVVDLDNDGHAEIVLVSNNYYHNITTGVRVFEGIKDDWMPTRSIWNQHAYHITNVNDDGTIPRHEEPSWLTHNTYRLNTFPDRSPLDSPDLTVGLLRVIDNGAGEPLTLMVRVGNGGVLPSPDSMASFYEGDPDAGGVLLGSVAVGSLSPGRYTDVMLEGVSEPAAEANLYALIDPQARIRECNEENNAVHIPFRAQSPPGRIEVGSDAGVYGPKAPVVLEASVTNTGALAASFRAELHIEDESGAMVTRFASQETGELDGGQSVSPTQAWNTQTLIAGLYRVRAVLRSMDGLRVDEATCSFEIRHPEGEGPVVALRTRTDRSRYSGTDTAQIRHLVENLTVSTILEEVRLQVTVSDPTGQVVFTQDVALGQLVPGALREVSTPYTFEGLPAGEYTVSSHLIDEAGRELAAAQTRFEVLGSSQTGEGLSAVLSARPDSVERGEEATVAYTVANHGNEPLTDLELKLLIIDADAEQIKGVFDASGTLAVGASLTGAFTVPTSALSPGVHLAVLRASREGMAEPETLGHATFQVKASLELTQTIPDVRTALVWLNYPRQSGQDCPDPTLIETALGAAGISCFLVFDKKDFQTELRNPYYTDFLILGDHHPIEDHFSEELREKVYGGRGLMVSLFNRHNLDEELFGIKVEGRLSGEGHPVELGQSELFDAETFRSSGRALRVEALAPESVRGSLIETTKKGLTRHPAVLSRSYGKGRVLWMGFDVGLSLARPDFPQELLPRAFDFIHRSSEVTAFPPNRLVPIQTQLRSLGGAFEIRLTQSCPAQLRLFDPLTGLWVTDEPWVRELHLGPDEVQRALAFVLTPDQPGVYPFETEVSLIESGASGVYQRLITQIVVSADGSSMAEEIASQLAGLSLGARDRAEAEEALRRVAAVRDRAVSGPADMEKNIADLLKAVEALRSITGADVCEIREAMGRWLEDRQAEVYLHGGA